MRSGRAGAAGLAAVVVLAACIPGNGADPADADLPTIAVLRSVPDADHAVFVEELRAQGWRVGEDVRVLPADGTEVHADIDEAREELRRWGQDGLDLVIAYSTPHAQLVAEEAPGVPGLFNLNDPVAAGLVEDLRHPDGQLTGVTFDSPADRTLHLTRQVIDGLERIGYAAPSDDPAVPGHRRAVLEAADALGIEVVEATFDGPDDVPRAIDELVQAEVGAVYLASSNATIQALDPLERALDRHALPAVANTDFATFAVVVLTPDRAEVRRQLARQTARLLSGAEVASVPVEDPRKFVLILNRTVLDDLGLPDLDRALLRQADLVR